MSMLDYFAYNPLQKRKLDPMPFGDAGELGDPYEFWAPSDAMLEQDPWRARNWQTQGNFEVLDADGSTGTYKVKVKSGDKEGTVYLLTPDDQGGYKSQEVGREKWDTNKHFFKDPQFRKFLTLAGLMGGAAWLQGSGLLGSSGAASAAAPVAESFPVAAYGPAVTAPLAPATITAEGLAIGGAGLAGPHVVGSAAGGAAAAAGKAAAGKTIADQIASWLGVPTWAVQLGGGLLGGAAGYLDAKRQEGKRQGGAPEVYAESMSLLRSAKPREPNAELMSRALGLLGTGSTPREVTGRTRQSIDDLLTAYGQRRSLL